MITWTNLEKAQDGSGETRYFGLYDGVRLFVINGVETTTGTGGRRREFLVCRLTGNGVEVEIDSARKLWHAKECCEWALGRVEASGELAGWLAARKERRALLSQLSAVGAARDKRGMSLSELRDAVAGLKARIEITPAGAAKNAAVVERVREVAAGARAADALLAQVAQRVTHGGQEFRVGDAVRFSGPVFQPGDRWEIERIYVPVDAGPYAGLRLVARRGGLPIGTTRTGISLSQVTVIDPEFGSVSAQVVLRELVEVFRNVPDTSTPVTIVRSVAHRHGIEL